MGKSEKTDKLEAALAETGDHIRAYYGGKRGGGMSYAVNKAPEWMGEGYKRVWNERYGVEPEKL